MNHWLILPVLIPAVTAPLIAMFFRHDILLARVFALISNVLMLAFAGMLLASAGDGQALAYPLGNWPVPFGIVLVLDRLSALMLLLTAILSFLVLLYAIGGWE